MKTSERKNLDFRKNSGQEVARMRCRVWVVSPNQGQTQHYLVNCDQEKCF